ncbi:MAG: hypothetical protein ACLPYS_20965 [Vulcanimicrobiaceae bacterium]
MNLIFLIVLGAAYFGVGDAGTVLAMIDQVEDGNSTSAFAVLTKYGTRALQAADAALDAGHRASARCLYLQVSSYIFAATYFCDGMGAPEKMLPAWQSSRHRDSRYQSRRLLGAACNGLRTPHRRRDCRPRRLRRFDRMVREFTAAARRDDRRRPEYGVRPRHDR